MGRWTQQDEDEHRLPQGMTRIAYDADTQKYSYRDSDGTVWQGEEGSRFGRLTKGQGAVGNDIDLEASGRRERADGYTSLSNGDGEGLATHSSTRGAYRTLLPFFLIILVVLLLVVRLAAPSLLANRGGTAPCPQNCRSYEVKKGDTCWAIARDYGSSVERLRDANQSLQCDKLVPGQKLCVPLASQD